MIRVFAAAACATLAFALDPDRAITQFVHTSWTAKDGAPANARALAQSRDGYLWIGTTAGLFRFDGVRFTAFDPPAGEYFPSSRIRRLLATRDGALWIVWGVGQVSRLQNGHVTSYSEKDGLPATAALVESDDGTIVAATANGLCRFERGAWNDTAKEWNFPAKQARGLYFDKAGTLWVETEVGAIYLPRGQKRFADSGKTLAYFYNFAQAPDGGMWVSETGRSAHTLRRERDATPETEVRVGASWVLFDRNGSLWVGSAGDGLRRVPRPDRISGKSIAQFGPEAEQFTAKDGLSGPIVVAILEDGEGNIWCATTEGLDRFRQGVFSTVEVPHPDLFRGIFASKDGNLLSFSPNPSELLRINPSGGKEVIARHFSVAGVCEDENGALWLLPTSHGAKVYQLREGRPTPVPLPGNPELKNLHGIACDHSGGVWLFDEQRGLFRLANHGLSRIDDSSDPGYQDANLFADKMGRVWLGRRDSIEMFDHGSRRRFDASDGLAANMFRSFAEDKAGNVWLGGDGRLARFDHDRFRQLSFPGGFPAQSVNGLVEDDDGYWWIACDAGVLRIRAEELDRAISDPTYRVHYDLFNLQDGLPGRPAVQLLPLLAKTGDGRIWVATANGIAYADPRRMPRNLVPPPVRVERLTVNGKEIAAADGLALPRGSNDLEIDYTALSLTIPERVRFKYKLEGYDSDWKDVGGRRQAYYGGLGPRNYRFRVIAANESGVWNEAGAKFDFSIAPAYYQTRWFQAACIVAFLASLWGLYRLRLRQFAREFHAQLEGRADERLRVARELHDTLLQSFHGVLPRLQAVYKLLPERVPEAKEILNKTIDDAAQAITEARDAVQNLRSSTVVTYDLAKAVQILGEDLAAHQSATNGVAATFSVEVEGAPQEIHPILRAEIYRITAEAVRNAFNHARARRIEVEIWYSARDVRVRVRDDGIGIEVNVPGQEAREGHFGLAGMRERAKHIRGKLEVWSERGAGTEVELRLPASVAYAHQPGRRSIFTRNASTKP